MRGCGDKLKSRGESGVGKRFRTRERRDKMGKERGVEKSWGGMSGQVAVKNRN